MRHFLLASFLIPAAQAAVDFSREVAPVLESRCQMCHGSKQQMSGLRLDQASEKFNGAKLIERITSTKPTSRMPPIGAPLKTEEIAVLQQWITSGANWPSGYRPAAAALHWSFQPIRQPAEPAIKNASWKRNGIDAFIAAKLDAEGHAPSPEADKATLFRRVSLDLTGLPPTPSEVASFLADSRPDAYERAVNTLLSSPHYGEKWARHWLDLARYADSDGYEKDQVRPYAWRYRNWVIEAFNRDMPFDRFTIEQLAGDLLPNPTVDQLVATGFHRNTLTNREAGVDRAEARFEQLVNRVSTTSTTWLAMTVGCAQCHNHKYDPISQKDFYSLFAFFDSAEESEVEAPLQGEKERFQLALPAYLGRRGHILERYGIAALQAKWEEKIRFAIDNPGKDLEWDFSITSMRAMFDYAERVLKTPPDQRTARDRQRLTDYFVTSPGPDFNRDEATRSLLREAREKLQEANAELPQLTMAATFINAAAYKTSNIRVKGDYRALGDPVNPATLTVLSKPASAHPSRLDLAQWLVSKENPLTARVAVNRAWQEFFGRGIVRTSEDFGTQGERPSHPELLDWLASRFVDDGWSMKNLHKLIVTSATYRQSSKVRPEIASKDPDNSLLSRQSRVRLSAEVIRDSALSSSGILDLRIGGPSIRPPQPAGVAELGYAGSVKWKESEGPDRHRRGLYIHFQRTTPYPQLMNFDAPDSNVACSRRRSSNSPLQSLNLLNDPVFFEAAQALAQRLLVEKASFADRIEHGYLLALGRPPTSSERQRLARLYDEQLSIFKKEPDSVAALAPTATPGSSPAETAAWAAVSRVILNLDEFITRE